MENSEVKLFGEINENSDSYEDGLKTKSTTAGIVEDAKQLDVLSLESLVDDVLKDAVTMSGNISSGIGSVNSMTNGKGDGGVGSPVGNNETMVNMNNIKNDMKSKEAMKELNNKDAAIIDIIEEGKL